MGRLKKLKGENTHENNSNSSKKLQVSARSVKKLTQKRIKHVYLRCLLTDLLEIRSEGRSQDPFRMVFYAKLQFVSKKTPKNPKNPIGDFSPA